MKFASLALALSMIFASLASGSLAQANPFGQGWSLDGENSSLSFLSIKDSTKVETSSFASFEGSIDEAGKAEVQVHLESIDTKIDLRNVRMRFLFFETFVHPKATIRTELDAASLADLAGVRRKTMPLDFVLDLHGIEKAFTADVIVTLLNENEVFVSTAEPISVSVADFGMGEGLKKLEEAAGLPIIPSATVSFDFRFLRNGSGGEATVATAAVGPTAASRALESSGELAVEECRNRFQSISEANEIYFGSGSARLQNESAPMLDSLADIIDRCPGLSIEVAGHTDDVGSEAANLALSERRAGSVAAYLVDKGIATDRIRIEGYGESRPVASNDTDRGRWRNRRIEFSMVDG
jgi:outer membrane protein OmpA-like peptidoglycan-associated protein